jgi:Uma2 family endonuclease
MTRSRTLGPVATMREPDGLYEIVDGQFVEIRPSRQSQLIANKIHRRIYDVLNPQDLGVLLLYMFFELPPKYNVRQPFVSFLSYNRWPKERPLTDGFGWPAVPELVIDVLSPTEVMAEVCERREEYFAAGVIESWLVDPECRRLSIFKSMDDVKCVEQGQAYSTPLLPGFELPLAELFPNRLDDA